MEYQRLNSINLKEHIGKRVYLRFMCKDVTYKLKKDGVSEYISLTIVDGDVNVTQVKKFSLKDIDKIVLTNGNVCDAAIDVSVDDYSPCGYSCKIYNCSLVTNEGSDYLSWEDNFVGSVEAMNTNLELLKGTVFYELTLGVINDVWTKFKVWTAANSMHHSAIGGLVVHTAEVATISDSIGQAINKAYGYEFINTGLLRSASLLHDVGKCVELSVDVKSGSTEYSVLATFGNHITIGVEMIDHKQMELGLGRYSKDFEINPVRTFEEEQIRMLRHCMLSHHGKKEYGSPLEPSIPEANILNYADKLSAEMNRYKQKFKVMEPGTNKVEWLSGNMVTYYKSTERE